ncbi:YggT family protein [Gammaproteobacteria bacterium]
MNGNYFANAIIFLISTLFGLYIFATLLRFLFGLVRADFYNPLSAALVKISNPLLLPLRRFIPGYRGFDWAALILLVALKFLEITLVGLMMGQTYRITGTLVWAIAELLALTLNVFIFSIIIEAMMSWFNPGSNPLTHLLYRLNYPLLNPTRRRLPPMSGFDLSPFVVIIVLQLFSLLIVAPILDFGRSLATGLSIIL